MTLYDAAMACLIVGGMAWGAWRGITWQIASIASLVLGYTVAHTASDDLAQHFPGDPVVARGLAMLVIYAAVSGGVFFVAWLVRATLRRLKFEAFDRHLGMILGGLEGVLVGLVGTLFVVSLAPSSRGPIFESPSGKVVAKLMGSLGPVLPSEARQVLSPFFERGSQEAVAETGPQPSVAPRSMPDVVDMVDEVKSKIADEILRPSQANARGRTTERR